MPRPRTYRVEAVVLRRIDFGEADRVLVVFTRERGKLPVPKGPVPTSMKGMRSQQRGR